MCRTGILAVATLLGLTAAAGAQPPFPQPQPFPGPGIPASPVDGRWFYRGNPFKPCYVQTVPTPFGPRLMFVNEKGTRAPGWLSPDGSQVTIPNWNLTGTVRDNAIVWPNGDFWSR